MIQYAGLGAELRRSYPIAQDIKPISAVGYPGQSKGTKIVFLTYSDKTL